ncbi:MAG: hypothetical protein GY822_10585 [Deltaproteobacteria bacterium]|nr:hypothetical protein [Deltaproteobacteria bacterium]
MADGTIVVDNAPMRLILVLSLLIFATTGCQCGGSNSTERVFLPAFSARIFRVDVMQVSSATLPLTTTTDAGVDDEPLVPVPLFSEKPTRIRVFVEPVLGFALGTRFRGQLTLFHPDAASWLMDDGGVQDAGWWLPFSATAYAENESQSVDDGGADAGLVANDAGTFQEHPHDAGVVELSDGGVMLDDEDGGLNAESPGDAGAFVDDNQVDSGIFVVGEDREVNIANLEPFASLSTERSLFVESSEENERSSLHFDLPAAWIRQGLSIRVELFEEVLPLGPTIFSDHTPLPERSWPPARNTDAGQTNDVIDGGTAALSSIAYLLPILEQTPQQPLTTLVLHPLLLPLDPSDEDCSDEDPLCDDVKRVYNPSADQLERLQQRLFSVFPTQRIQLIVAPARTLSTKISAFGDGWSEALLEVTVAHLEQEIVGNVFSFGMLLPSENRQTFCPLSCIAGQSTPFENGESVSTAIILAFDDEETPWTLLHEWGHLLGRQHAPCGIGEGEVDTDFPYESATLGKVGFDAVFREQISARRHDLMSYCEPRWISDHTYAALFAALRSSDERIEKSQEKSNVDAPTSAVLFGAQQARLLQLRNPPSTAPEKVVLLDPAGRELIRWAYALPQQEEVWWLVLDASPTWRLKSR